MREARKERKISVNSVLKILGVSTSGYYANGSRKPSKNSIRKEKVKKEIIQIYNESKQIYGAPKITKVLHLKGYKIAEKTVGNYMREDGIKAIWVKPYTRTTVDPDFDKKLKNVLKREFNPSKPNAVWVTDITYIHTMTGFVYLTSIMDLYSRAIISWHLSAKLTTEGVLEAVRKAKTKRMIDQPVVIHSDRGTQYVSRAYLYETPANEFIRSYSRKGNPWDNACIESFHALIKREWLDRHMIRHIRHAHELVFEYIDTFYNTTRLHSYCGMMSPYEYEARFTAKSIPC